MQVFEEIVKDGMTGGEVFKRHLSKFIFTNDIRTVIETGTYHGQGTTLAIMEGFDKQHEYKLITIENNPEHHKIASRFWYGKTGIELWHGLSIPRSKDPIDMTFNVPDNIIVDYKPEVREKMYRNEISFRGKENLLKEAIADFKGAPDMVLLDSVGYMGRIEFLHLMELIGDHSFFLALDDTKHVKHYESMEIIRGMPEKFEILWEVDSIYNDPDNGDSAGSAIIRVK